ncbi:MAG: GtrA family protein [Selenomonadaceae bacterium]|nr:GtrA family protein [Selenomonadaceae bacterium]
MTGWLGQLKHHFWTREFMLFLLIGTFNTLNCSFIAKGLMFFLPDANIAFNIGYIISNILAYWLNSRFVFFETLSLHRYVKFFLSYVPNYIIQNIIVVIFYNVLGFPDIVSFIIAAILGVPITFLCVKIFAFGRK